MCPREVIYFIDVITNVKTAVITQSAKHYKFIPSRKDKLVSASSNAISKCQFVRTR